MSTPGAGARAVVESGRTGAGAPARQVGDMQSSR